MTESSYYPLRRLKSLEDAQTSQHQNFKSDSDPRLTDNKLEAEDPLAARSTMSLVPLRKSPGRQPLLNMISTPLKMALLPLAGISYLAFCYTVHGTVVPVNTYGLYSVTTDHLATIKGGITTISIIIISIALFPIYDMISNLKSEEFFRSLTHHSQGVPLETVNYISTSTFGHVDTAIAMWRRRCSNYYVLGTVASLFAWVISTFAPGALTIDSVLADGPLVAFSVGAVTPQSVLNGSYPTEPAFNASLNSVTASSIAWAETELGVQYSFSTANTSDYAAFIAPAPLTLPTSTSARWLSDVIGINPTCSWPSTNITSTVQLPFNSTVANEEYFATAYLSDYDLDVLTSGQDLSSSSGGPFAVVKDPTSLTNSLSNHTTQAPASDGSTVFLLGQCSGCDATTAQASGPVNITLDLSSLDTTFTVAMTDVSWTFAILVCTPNVTVETREVRNNGQGILSVQPPPSGRQLTRQGNLNPIQTRAMFSIATMSLTQNAGALSGDRVQYTSLGSQVQGALLFGQDQFMSLPGTGATQGTQATISPAPIEDITQAYTQVIQSAAKAYVAGYLGVAYVPGRISASEIVFAASIPNLAVASAVFALLAALIVLAHFRPGKGAQFSLVNVAAAVHDSELPATFAQLARAQPVGGDAEAGGRGKARDFGVSAEDVAEMGDRRIYMQTREDGSRVLHMS